MGPKRARELLEGTRDLEDMLRLRQWAQSLGDPELWTGFRDMLRTELREDIPLSTHEHHVNDPEFGRLVARLFLDLIQETPV